MKETFGQRLSRIRKEKGYTQEDIASRITISPQAVSKWENDISSPDILVLSSLADILGVSVDELLGREGEEEKTSSRPNEERKDDDVEVEHAEEVKDKDEGVHINNSGVHIKDDDGSEIHVTNKGIFIKDEDGSTKEIHPKIMIHKVFHKVSVIISSVVCGLALVGYILLGILWTDQQMGWKMGWLLFFLVPIIGSLFQAIEKKKICHFAYPVLALGAYLTLGFLGMYFGFPSWEFYWFLFLTIPAFYLIFHPVDKYVLHHGEEDDDDNDDEDEVDD